MALSHKAKRRWSLFILIFGVPIYIVMAVTLIDLLRDVMGRPSILIELGVFVLLGVLWAFPLKAVFKGVGQADPNAPPEDEQH
ncbi:DUF2842 domain-containing protein [Nereida sp.]|uniref:DUF2842 domain-containing protein n=1 Tax=Nereida sp. TaxID=2736090 RepID=UPI003F69BCBD